MSTEAVIAGLETGKLFSFSDWPNEEIPRVSVGVYTVWLGQQLVYVGYSGRNLRPHEIKAARKPKGLLTRLKSHRTGLRSEDQFSLYVCDRFIIPVLDTETQQKLAAGERLLEITECLGRARQREVRIAESVCASVKWPRSE